MTKYKFDKRKTFSRCFITFFGSIFIILMFFTLFITDDIPFKAGIFWLLAASFFVLYNGISLLFNYFITKGECFYFTNDSIVYELNFIIKRKVSLPYNKINLINTKRNISDMILRLSSLRLGSGSVATAAKEEIKLVFARTVAAKWVKLFEKISAQAKSGSSIDALAIENEINSFMVSTNGLSEKIEENVEPSGVNLNGCNKAEVKQANCVRLKKKDILKMAITSGITFIIVVCVMFSLIFALIFANFNGADLEMSTGGFAFMVIILSLATLILGFIVSLIVLALKYYDFKAYREGNNIKMSYGLISIKTNSIPFDKIHGLVLKQNIIRRIFGLGSLQLVVVGLVDYGSDEQGGSGAMSYLLPIASLQRLAEVQKELLPEFTDDFTAIKTPNKKSIKHYFIIPNLIGLLCVLPFIILLFFLRVGIWCCIAAILVFIIVNINSILQLKNAKMSIGNNYSKFVYGGLVKTTLICSTKSIQQVETIAGTIRRKDNIATVRVSVRGLVIGVKMRNIHDVTNISYN